jgi:hypothetical protein
VIGCIVINKDRCKTTFTRSYDLCREGGFRKSRLKCARTEKGISHTLFPDTARHRANQTAPDEGSELLVPWLNEQHFILNIGEVLATLSLGKR